MLDAMTNFGRWPETVRVRFPETEFGPRILEKMLSISVLELLELLVTLVGCMCGKNIWEERESRNSLIGAWWSYFSRSTLKSLSKKSGYTDDQNDQRIL